MMESKRLTIELKMEERRKREGRGTEVRRKIFKEKETRKETERKRVTGEYFLQ